MICKIHPYGRRSARLKEGKAEQTEHPQNCVFTTPKKDMRLKIRLWHPFKVLDVILLSRCACYAVQ